MQITVLGSGTSVPRPGRAPSGLLVREAGVSLLLDGGAGSALRMCEAGVYLEDLDRVLYTHLHNDHIGELVPMLFALRNPDIVRTKRFHVHGPPALGPLLDRLHAAWGKWIEAPPCGVELHLWSEGETAPLLGGWLVDTRRVAHGADAHGLRLTAPSGQVVTYPGDTDECDAVVELGRDADVLILECSHPDDRKVDGHLSPTPCGRLAARAGAKALVLTHFYPGWDPQDAVALAAREYDGPIVIAHDGLEITP